MRSVSKPTKSMPSENGDCLEKDIDSSSRDRHQSLFPIFWAEMSLGTASATTQVAVDDLLTE
jgi:hypothetical protein